MPGTFSGHRRPGENTEKPVRKKGIMDGILYGIGVGPGDPEMLTLKAVKTINKSDVICIPKKDRNTCRAYQTAAAAVPELVQKEVLGFDFEMTRSAERLQQLHREIYETVKAYLVRGETVSFLTIGDPAVYATFSYIAEQAAQDGFRVCILNGITSFCACAAALGIPLCEGKEELHVIPDTVGLERSLSLPGTKVLMKGGRHIKEIKDILLAWEQEREAEGRPVCIYGVSECSTQEEKLYFGAGQLPEDGRYMMTIIIKDGK